ncbi:MAG: glutaredoxin family protein, partial [Clostridia bacterium]|nr:glutaredoxin family protein [Clostridia bacterium]
AEEKADAILLFATHTCPNCKMAKIFLDKAGIEYEVVYADDNPETAAEFEIKQAPTMVVSKNGETEVITNVSNIRKFAEMNS